MYYEVNDDTEELVLQSIFVNTLQAFQIEPIVEDDKPMPRSQGIVKKISYDDGKTWIEIQELKNVRIVD
jgi:hypothetical protein|tara:strand:+ start:2677 stop:2883 length:207 start_codon:yes stop_codon:yes gene_type:complete